MNYKQIWRVYNAGIMSISLSDAMRVDARTLNQTKQHRNQVYFIDFLLFVLLALLRPTKLSLVWTRSISYGLS